MCKPNELLLLPTGIFDLADFLNEFPKTHFKGGMKMANAKLEDIYSYCLVCDIKMIDIIPEVFPSPFSTNEWAS